MRRFTAFSSPIRRVHATESSSKSSASTLPVRTTRVRSRSTRREPTIGSILAPSPPTPYGRSFGAPASSSGVMSRDSELSAKSSRFRSARSRTKQPPAPRAPPTHMPGPEYAIVGLIRKAQGIRGEVVVEPLTDKPDVVFASGSRVFAGTTDGELAIARDVRGEEEAATLTIARSQPFKKGLIVQFEELQDRDSAELWRGRYLLAPFSELPPLQEDEVYLHDLTGMKVVSAAGAEIGNVTA